MTASEYIAALDALCLSQTGAGEFFGVHRITAHRWAETGPPEPVAKLLRLMLALQFSVEYVERVTREA
jgi:hypothetical protein